MAKWSDIANSQKYLSLPNEQKFFVKKNWAKKHIFPNKDFQAMPEEGQLKLLVNFAATEDNIDRSFVQNFLKGTELAHQTPDRFALKHKGPAFIGGAIGANIPRAIRKASEIVDYPFEAAATFFERSAKKTKKYLDENPQIKQFIQHISPYTEFTNFMAVELIRSFKPTNVLLASVAGPAIGFIAKKTGAGIAYATPEKVKEPMRRFFFSRFGAPKEYLAGWRLADLEKGIAYREIEKTGKKLFYAAEDITVHLKGGGTKILKEGEIFPEVYQNYLGRLFRREVDLGGRRPNLPDLEDPAILIKQQLRAERINEDVAASPIITRLTAELDEVGKLLGSKKLAAESQIGKVFRTDTGFIEKATGVEGEIIRKKGGFAGKDYKLVSEPVTPTEGPIPSNLGEGMPTILRSPKQVSKAPAIVKSQKEERIALLKRKRVLERQ